MSTPLSPETRQLAHLVHRWHSHVLAQLDHLIAVPLTEILEVSNTDTGSAEILTGVEREKFLQGLLVARTFFATLPFAPHQDTQKEE